MRSRSCTPQYFSNSRIALETLDCAKYKRLAASLIEPVSAAERKHFICCNVIISPSSLLPLLGFDEHIDHLGLAVIFRLEVGVFGLEVLDLLEKMVNLALGLVADDLHLGVVGGVDTIESIPIVLVVIQGAF